MEPSSWNKNWQGSDALDLGSYCSQQGFDWIIRNQRHAKFILCRILMANQENKFLVDSLKGANLVLHHKSIIYDKYWSIMGKKIVQGNL